MSNRKVIILYTYKWESSYLFLVFIVVQSSPTQNDGLLNIFVQTIRLREPKVLTSNVRNLVRALFNVWNQHDSTTQPQKCRAGEDPRRLTPPSRVGSWGDDEHLWNHLLQNRPVGALHRFTTWSKKEKVNFGFANSR